MYKYLTGKGQIWVDSVPPPENSTNVLWLKFPEHYGNKSESQQVKFEVDLITGELIMLVRNCDPNGEGWTTISDITGKGFELLVYVQTAGTNQGEWYPIQGSRGPRGYTGVVVSDTEPEDPEVKIWVDTSDVTGNILTIEHDMLGDTDNVVAQKAIKEWVLSLLEEVKKNPTNGPIIL